MATKNTSGRTSKHGKKLSRLLAHQTCRGCGRRLPKGSWVLIWQVWIDYQRDRFRLCSDCPEIVYGCEDRRPICHQDDEFIVRDLCECCDRFPFCEKVEYLRRSEPGDWFFGDLPIDGNGAQDEG